MGSVHSFVTEVFREFIDSINRDELCPGENKDLYNEVYKKLIDLGDIIGIEGELFTTQVGEKTVRVQGLSLLSKSLRPLPLPKTDAEGHTFDAFVVPFTAIAQYSNKRSVNSIIQL